MPRKKMGLTAPSVIAAQSIAIITHFATAPLADAERDLAQAASILKARSKMNGAGKATASTAPIMPEPHGPGRAARPAAAPASSAPASAPKRRQRRQTATAAVPATTPATTGTTELPEPEGGMGDID